MGRGWISGGRVVDGEVELEQKKGGCRYDAGLQAKWDTIPLTQHSRPDK